MWKNGEIQDMWSMARQTHLTFNMVGSWAALDCWLARLAVFQACRCSCHNWSSVHAVDEAPSIPSQACLTQLSAHAAMPTDVPAMPTDVPASQVTFGLTCALLVFVAATYMFTRTRPVYLLNYHCFKPPAK